MHRHTPRPTHCAALFACLLACAPAFAQQGMPRQAMSQEEQDALLADCQQQPDQAAFDDCMAAAQPPPSAEQVAAMTRATTAMAGWSARVAQAAVRRGGAMDHALAVLVSQPAAGVEPAAGQGRPTAAASPAQLARWRQQAVALAGDDAFANAFVGLALPVGAERAVVARRWARAQPDNIAPLMRQDLPVDTLLQQAGTRTQFDLMGYQQMRWMAQAFAATPPTSVEEAALRPDADDAPFNPTLPASSLWNAVALPAMATVVEACDEEGLQATPARRNGCRHLAQVLADTSDTAAVEQIGLRLLAGAARTDAERRAVVERERTFDWQMQQWGRLSSAQADGGLGEFTRLLADPTISGERELVQRLLASAGVPLQPPAQWRMTQP